MTIYCLQLIFINKCDVSGIDIPYSVLRETSNILQTLFGFNARRYGNWFKIQILLANILKYNLNSTQINSNHCNLLVPLQFTSFFLRVCNSYVTMKINKIHNFYFLFLFCFHFISFNTFTFFSLSDLLISLALWARNLTSIQKPS